MPEPAALHIQLPWPAPSSCPGSREGKWVASKESPPALSEDTRSCLQTKEETDSQSCSFLPSVHPGLDEQPAPTLGNTLDAPVPRDMRQPSVSTSVCLVPCFLLHCSLLPRQRYLSQWVFICHLFYLLFSIFHQVGSSQRLV